MDKNICREIGMRLREARLRSGLTQRQVADACGVTRQLVSRWEKGDPLPSTGQWYVLGLLLGASLQYLVYGPVMSKIFREPPATEAAQRPEITPA